MRREESLAPIRRGSYAVSRCGRKSTDIIEDALESISLWVALGMGASIKYFHFLYRAKYIYSYRFALIDNCIYHRGGKHDLKFYLGT